MRLIRDGEKGVWRLMKREIIYLSLNCHHQNDSCIKMGSDESHFNVSIGSDGQSHKTVSTNHNPFEESRMEVGGGKREIIYLSLHCQHQNDSALRWAVILMFHNYEGQSQKTVSTDHNF